MKKYFARLVALTLSLAASVTLFCTGVSAGEQLAVVTTIETDETGENEKAEITEEEAVTTFSIPGSIFDDVPEDAWYTPYVEYVLNKGIMTGMGNNTYAPGEYLKRAQFAAVLYRMSGSQPISYSNRFQDVPDGTFFTSSVLWAAQEDVNVIEGYDNGYFGPGDVITREQLVTMLYRYAKYKGLDTAITADLSLYPDAASVTEFAQDAMKWAVGIGIITGDQGQLNPQGNCSRAECAAMIRRFCEALVPEEIPDVEYYAGCSGITMTPGDMKDGSFWIKLTGVSASHGIIRVYAAVWCYNNQEDIAWYEAQYQSDGSYGFAGKVSNHRFHFGTYSMYIYVLMDNGVRLMAASGQGQIDGTEAINMWQRAQSYSSSTDYLLLVDTNTCKTGIFTWNGSMWDYLCYWPCSPGAPSSPTVKGVFTVQAKGYSFYAFGSLQYYYTQFYGDYLFHSITYNLDGSIQDGRLGMQLSHGCVRLDTSQAKWIYDNIPAGTTVVIY